MVLVAVELCHATSFALTIDTEALEVGHRDAAAVGIGVQRLRLPTWWHEAEQLGVAAFVWVEIEGADRVRGAVGDARSPASALMHSALGEACSRSRGFRLAHSVSKMKP